MEHYWPSVAFHDAIRIASGLDRNDSVELRRKYPDLRKEYILNGMEEVEEGFPADHKNTCMTSEADSKGSQGCSQ